MRAICRSGFADPAGQQDARVELRGDEEASSGVAGGHGPFGLHVGGAAPRLGFFAGPQGGPLIGSATIFAKARR